jgi:hypothetical protein
VNVRESHRLSMIGEHTNDGITEPSLAAEPDAFDS